MAVSYLITMLITGIMVYTAIIDYERKEIPIELFLLVLAPAGIIGIIFGIGPTWPEACLAAGITGGSYWLIARFFGGGGGDVIMMSVLAICLGYRIGLVILTATVLLAGYRLWEIGKGKEETEVAYAPFVLTGIVVERIFCFL